MPPNDTPPAAPPWRVFWDEAHRLMLQGASTPVLVNPNCCFPWSHPHSYISLRDDKEVEHAFIKHLSDLDPEQRGVMVEALQLRNFIPEILAIHAIADDQELYVWSVSTGAGDRKFLTERRDHVRQLPGGRLLVRDVANDVLLIRDPKALDPKSYALIRAQID